MRCPLRNLRVAEKRPWWLWKEKAVKEANQSNHAGESGRRASTPWVGEMITKRPSAPSSMRGRARVRRCWFGWAEATGLLGTGWRRAAGALGAGETVAPGGERDAAGTGARRSP